MEIWIWVGFIVFILFMLALDLGIFNRNPHEITIKESLVWTIVWILLALLFNVGVYFFYEHHWLGIGDTVGHQTNGATASLNFLTAYIIEKSLSLDNIFVFALIFSYFDVPLRYQHRVLFYGILGALIMRGVMIAAGVVLIERFDWIIYVFGIFLIITAVRFLFASHEKLEPEKNPLFRLTRTMFPLTDEINSQRFFTKLNGKTAITPLFLVLILVESSDVLFAIDSIPAVFAVTHDPFLVFTSNVFAILGLRALYFTLAGVLKKFRYLKVSLFFLLAYVGVKMLLSHHYHIPPLVSLAIIAGILLIGIVASIIRPAENEHQTT